MIRNESGETERVHLISVAALLETPHRIPNLDYHTLMKLTKDFTEVEKLFWSVCFGAFAYNRDEFEVAKQIGIKEAKR